MLSRFRRVRILYKIMKNCPVFQDLTFLEWRRLEMVAHERTFKPNEIIFEQGDEGLGLYIIIEGKVQLAFEDHGVLREIDQLSPGDTFGEMTLIDGRDRLAQAVALEETKLLVLFRPDVLNLIRTAPRVAAKVYSRLAELAATRLRSTLEQFKKMQRVP